MQPSSRYAYSRRRLFRGSSKKSMRCAPPQLAPSNSGASRSQEAGSRESVDSCICWRHIVGFSDRDAPLPTVSDQTLFTTGAGGGRPVSSMRPRSPRGTGARPPWFLGESVELGATASRPLLCGAADRIEDCNAVQVVPPARHFAVLDGDHRDEVVVVGPPGLDCLPVTFSMLSFGREPLPEIV